MRGIQGAAVLVALLLVGQGHAQSAPGAASFVAAARPEIRSSPPVRTLNGFVENKGQWPDEVQFFARYGRIDLTLLPDALVFRPTPDRVTGEWPAPLVLRLPRAVEVTGEGALPTQHNFLLGSIRVSHASGFERVVYHDVAPGIDLAVHIGTKGFEYDVNAAPGADVSDLVLSAGGADSLAIEDGVLALQTSAGRVEQRIGAAWQTDASGAHVPVQSRFRIAGAADGTVSFGFEAPARNPASALVIDPSLVYATYVGGSNQDLLQDMSVASSGAVYLTAQSSSGAPTTPGSFQSLSPGSVDAWVGKLSPDGDMLEWGTFLGGAGGDVPVGVDVDHDGSVVVAGHTWSSNFPTTPGSLQPIFAGVAGENDLFITRLAANGNSLVWSTFYGGPDFALASASALFPSGDVLVAAEPNSADTPATPGAFDTAFQPGKQMLIRVTADGSQLAFQTYFKASYISGVAIDESSNITFAGYVQKQDAPLPTTPGAFKPSMAQGDSTDAFVARLDPMGAQLEWATYLGGDTGFDAISGIALDAASAVYVCGLTVSNDFPVTAGAFDSSLSGGGDGFVAKLLPGGSGLVWCTYIGSCCGGSSSMDRIAVDNAGNAIAIGSSNEGTFPTTPDAFQPSNHGDTDVIFTKFDPFGEKLVYSTWFGGSSTDYRTWLGLDGAQDPHFGFVSYSGNLPITPGAYDSTNAGGGDIAVAKLDLPSGPRLVLASGLVGAVDTPDLAGDGTLVPGTPARLSTRGAAHGSSAFLIAGLSAINLPTHGGTFVPAPDVILPLLTDASGAMDLPFLWPSVPSQTQLTLQVWIKDAAATHGWSATNAFQMTGQ